MYKVLLVDDESMIRNGIKNSVPWAELGITEVKTAANGLEALGMISSFQPEIVLTDIRMPEMDGLELLEQIKSTSPETKVVILSGFDEFSYAQKAVKLGAFDYLLKTANLNEIKNVILSAINAIKQQQMKHQQLVTGWPLYREKLFQQLFYARQPWVEVSEKLNAVGIDSKEWIYVLAVAEIGTSENATQNSPILQEQINWIAEEHLGQHGYCFEGKYDEFVWIYLFENEESYPDQLNIFINKCNDILKTIYKNFGLNLHIGMSEIGLGLEQIRKCYEEAAESIEAQSLPGKGGITQYQSVEQTDRNYFLSKTQERNLISLLRTGDHASICQTIEIIFDSTFKPAKLSKVRLQQFLVDLFSLAILVLREYDLEVEIVFGQKFLYLEEIKQIKDWQEAKNWLAERMAKEARYILEHKLVKNKTVVESAKSYIEAHYPENLTLTRVAETVHMSPNYFSSVFSSEAGQSFMEYLTSRRIEKAKLMLVDKDAKAFEVGEKVGYDNPQYFSRIFKKYTGMSPSEYKESVFKKQTEKF